MALGATPKAAASCAMNALSPSEASCTGLRPTAIAVLTVVADCMPGRPGGIGGGIKDGGGM